MTDGLHDKAHKPPGTPPTIPVGTPVPLSGVEVTDNDPDVSWDLWNQAIADLNASASTSMADTQPAGLEAYTATQPVGLEEKTPEQRQADFVAVIEKQYPKIAAAIRVTWGFKECAAYINKLVLNGSEDEGYSRMGFNPVVLDAMMALSDLHEAQFGNLGAQEETGFGDYSVRSGLEGSR